MRDLSSLIYSSDGGKLKKSEFSNENNQFHHQSKSELIPHFYECNEGLVKDQSEINKSMIINDENQIRSLQNMYCKDTMKNEHHNECATIFPSNLSRIDETAKYEDESSISNQSYSPSKFDKLQRVYLKNNEYSCNNIYSHMIQNSIQQLTIINEIQNSNEKLWDNNASLKYVSRSDWTEEVPKIKYDSTPDPTSEEENYAVNSKFIFKRKL